VTSYLCSNGVASYLCSNRVTSYLCSNRVTSYLCSNGVASYLCTICSAYRQTSLSVTVLSGTRHCSSENVCAIRHFCRNCVRKCWVTKPKIYTAISSPFSKSPLVNILPVFISASYAIRNTKSMSVYSCADL
jgi:hypothetical protein